MTEDFQTINTPSVLLGMGIGIFLGSGLGGLIAKVVEINFMDTVMKTCPTCF